MKTITRERPDEPPFSDEELTSELRLAAAIRWYDRGLISQGKAVEVAGLDRTSFLLALGQANVDAFRISDEELKEEVVRGLEAYRRRLASAPHLGTVAT
jgi:predicted HTH domain antitoxin